MSPVDRLHRAAAVLDASQRAIAEMVGVDHRTIGHDLDGGENSPPAEKSSTEKQKVKKATGENSPPAWFSTDADPAAGDDDGRTP